VLTMRQEGAFYCCHRASCGEVGMLGPRGAGAMRARDPMPISQIFAAEYRLARPGDYWHSRLESATDGLVSPALAGLHVLAHDPDTCVWKCHSLSGEIRGYQTRRQEAGGGKRVRTYRESMEPMYHVVPPTSIPTVSYAVIVEDALSAACVASHQHYGIALLGTYLSKELAEEIAAYDFQAIQVALDPGAEEASSKAAARLRAYVACPVYQIFLPEDLKDLPVQEQRSMINCRY